MGNPFFTFLNNNQNAQIFFLKSNYILLYGKTAFGNDFGHALSLSCIFWLGHFQRSEIISKSDFPIKSYIIDVLKFLGAFWLVFKKEKEK